MPNTISNELIKHLGIPVEEIKIVTGGDINTCYKLSGNSSNYFIKINLSSTCPSMFKREAKGLMELSKASSIRVPNVINYGTFNDIQYLVLEWIDKGRSVGQKYWELLGKGIAEIHNIKSTYFGWEEDNYIGTLIQRNQKNKSWTEFYYTERIFPLLEQLHKQNHLEASVLKHAEKLYARFNDFPNEEPCLLHGDLWNGNCMADAFGNPVVFDPAVYFGHREIDLGMTLLFGGFDKAFYESYQYHFPLQPGWQQRVQLTQLYPLLVHACLFGGAYIREVLSIIKSM